MTDKELAEEIKQLGHQIAARFDESLIAEAGDILIDNADQIITALERSSEVERLRKALGDAADQLEGVSIALRERFPAPEYGSKAADTMLTWANEARAALDPKP